MSEFSLNSTLGRDVLRYNDVVKVYQKKLADYNAGISSVAPTPPKHPFNGQTQSAIAEALQNRGHADELRAAPGMIALALGRKNDE